MIAYCLLLMSFITEVYQPDICCLQQGRGNLHHSARAL